MLKVTSSFLDILSFEFTKEMSGIFPQEYFISPIPSRNLTKSVWQDLAYPKCSNRIKRLPCMQNTGCSNPCRENLSHLIGNDL